MDILIPDEWLRDFLKTKANEKQIAEYLTLCGPSVERVENSVYSIEVTTNRVDSASILGIAREAAAILPQFGLKASLHSIKLSSLNFRGQTSYLKAEVDELLCPRFTAVLIRDVKIKPSPGWITQRLLAVGVRPINNVVDISNYIMHELGQPVHTFDYNKIKGSKMLLRASKPGERLTTLDGKNHTLPGGDIVIEDGSGRLIDLAGIMGGENSAVDEKTKNILLFVQTYNPVNIRKTSMSLSHRTEAAGLFEKGLDPELVTSAVARGIELFIKLTQGKPDKEILDIYPRPYKPKTIKTNLGFIENQLGITLSKGKVTGILNALGIATEWRADTLEATIPSYRLGDISIPVDIVEEVARLYGYHKLPSMLMPGDIPEPPQNTPFPFEKRVKEILAGWGAAEVYSLSLVPNEYIGNQPALRLKNPLGVDSEYLRISLMPSLVYAANQNRAKDPFHLFEMANIYTPRRGELPDEKMVLAGIFYKTDFREAKGVIEALLQKLNVQAKFSQNEKAHYSPSKYLEVISSGKSIGEFGVLEDENLIYYEFDMNLLRHVGLTTSTFTPIPKYPAQIEDITLDLPERTKVGDVLQGLRTASKLVSHVELGDVFKNAYTFRLHYLDPEKTLTDEEVAQLRKTVLNRLKEKLGATLKD